MKLNLKFFALSLVLISIGSAAGYFGFSIYSDQTVQRINTSEMSKSENFLRKKLNEISSKYEVNLRLVRKKDRIIIRIWDVNVFKKDSWKLLDQGKEIAKELSFVLQKMDQKTYFILSGHHDSTNPFAEGDGQSNKYAIGVYRAAQIAEYMIGAGLKPERLLMRTFGNRKPLLSDRDQEDNYLADAGDLNRRLELMVKMRGVL